jgi:hypothetical protein
VEQACVEQACTEQACVEQTSMRGTSMRGTSMRGTSSNCVWMRGELGMRGFLLKKRRVVGGVAR